MNNMQQHTCIFFFYESTTSYMSVYRCFKLRRTNVFYTDCSPFAQLINDMCFYPCILPSFFPTSMSKWQIPTTW